MSGAIRLVLVNTKTIQGRLFWNIYQNKRCYASGEFPEERTVERKRIVFNPEFTSKKAETVTDTVFESTKTLAGIRKEMKANQRTKDGVKMRKLNTFDKYILVKLGKFKSISEVPDEIKEFNKNDIDSKKYEEMKASVKETMFKNFFAVDYTFFVLCILFCSSVAYLLKKQKKLKSTSEANIE